MTSAFNIGDLVRIKKEWLDSEQEADKVFTVVNVNEVTHRCIIEWQNSGMALAPTELVGFDMIEAL